MLFLISVSLAAGCASIKNAFQPEITQLPVSEKEFSVLLPFTENDNNTNAVKGSFFRNSFEESTQYAWGKRTSDYDFQKYFELVRIEGDTYYIRDGLYQFKSSRGTRIGDSYTEYQIEITCSDKEKYAQCNLKAINGKRVVGHHYAENYAPIMSDQNMIMSLLNKGYYTYNKIDTGYDLEVIRGELTRKNITSRISQNGQLNFSVDRVLYSIKSEKVKNGYYLEIAKKLFPEGRDSDSVDYVSVNEKSDIFLDALVR